jgi:tRNA (guanine-N7-)-methyltransferase
MITVPPEHRPIVRTFKPRRRSLSAARAAAYEVSMQRFGLPAHGGVVTLPELFGSSGPFVLEIGFGAGEGLLDLARARPHECVVGVEVHTTGLALVLEALESEAITNVRVVDGDALEFIDRMAPGSLDEIRILFPDPWPKHRQRHRRIVRPDTVASFTTLLRHGGALHLATDIRAYSLQMQQVCDGETRLSGGVVSRPLWRPRTRFEMRGHAEGRTAIDLRYVRD